MPTAVVGFALGVVFCVKKNTPIQVGMGAYEGSGSDSSEIGIGSGSNS